MKDVQIVHHLKWVCLPRNVTEITEHIIKIGGRKERMRKGKYLIQINIQLNEQIKSFIASRSNLKFALTKTFVQ